MRLSTVLVGAAMMIMLIPTRLTIAIGFCLGLAGAGLLLWSKGEM